MKRELKAFPQFIPEHDEVQLQPKSL